MQKKKVIRTAKWLQLSEIVNLVPKWLFNIPLYMGLYNVAFVGRISRICSILSDESC